MFLKQYGELRTGTNALRALVASNCTNVVVLMHILGDKHSSPVRLIDLWREAQACDDPSFEFVWRATFAAPSATTRSDDECQREEIRRCARRIAADFERGDFGWLISIRNPYAWAPSVIRFLGWPESSCDRLEIACRAFNEHYRAWLAPDDGQRPPAAVVRHEDLLGDAEDVLRHVADAFLLQRTPSFVAIGNVVVPAHWDSAGTPTLPRPFDRARPEPRTLSDTERAVITEGIDWELLQPFGYFAE